MCVIPLFGYDNVKVDFHWWIKTKERIHWLIHVVEEISPNSPVT